MVISTDQEIPSNQRVHHHGHRFPSVDPILSHFSAFHIFTAV